MTKLSMVFPGLIALLNWLPSTLSKMELYTIKPMH